MTCKYKKERIHISRYKIVMFEYDFCILLHALYYINIQGHTIKILNTEFKRKRFNFGLQ